MTVDDSIVETARSRGGASVDLPVSSPAGAMRYQPAPPESGYGAHGARLAWMPDEFGCLEACIATMLGVEFGEVPSGPRGDHTRADELEARERLDAWLAGRGYRRRDVPITRSLLNRWWIGVSVDPAPGWDHCVVCCCRRIVHDPALRFVAQLPGLEVEPIARLDSAIVIERTEDR
jgi:hypothetical protein